MKIVQILPRLEEGGVERGVVELNREFVIRGHQSVVVSAGGRQEGDIESGGGKHIRLDVASKNPFSAPFRALLLRKILKSEAPDIVHFRSRIPGWLVRISGVAREYPIVSTVHGFNSVSSYSRVMTKANRVICVSNAVKTYIQEHYHTPDRLIRIVPRGVDLNYFHPGRVDAHRKASFSDEFGLKGKTVVTAVGRLTQLKDFETFIEAVTQLSKQQPEVVGLIVGGTQKGKEDYESRLRSLKDSNPEGHRIVFAGSQHCIPEIFSLSSVVVSSSKKPESFGRTAAEALAMNVPVVATRHGGVVDIVQQGINGYLVPPANPGKLAEAINQSLNRSWGELRPFIQENFSLEQMVERTLQAYRDLVR